MKIPVLWVSWHDDILARGYQDQGFLEAMFANEVWKFPKDVVFEHQEVRGDFPPDIDGAIVILPARHHVEEADRFVAELDKLKWSLVILSSDEESVFPWEKVPQTETRKVWVMQAIPPHADLSALIPCGWYPGTKEFITAGRDETSGREYDWMFGGQVTHIRRQECAEVLRTLDNGYLHETPGYLQGEPRAEYFRHLANARVIPSPSGPMHVDTARTFEALEAGCIPVCDLVKPLDPQFNYWKLLFGEDMPLPTIANWSDFPNILNNNLKNWTYLSNQCFSFWQLWKRKITKKLYNDICKVSGLSATEEKITVIVTTSPIKSHPSTDVITATINSIRELLPLSDIIIAVDGVRAEQSFLRENYNEYVRRLLWKCNFEWENVVCNVEKEWVHQAGTIKSAMLLVDTPLVLMVEHDTPIRGPIDWDGINKAILDGYANVIRFHHEATIFPEHQYMMLDQGPVNYPNDTTGVPLLRTKAWWQRPHVASARFYREKILSYFSTESRTFIEDKIYGIFQSDILDNGEGAWWNWRVFIYDPPVDSIQFSYHINGREDEPKYEMKF